MLYSNWLILLSLIGAAVLVVIILVKLLKSDGPYGSGYRVGGPELIRQYRELYENGTITFEEFERKKKDILEGRDSKGSFLDYVDELAEDRSYRILWFVLGFFIQLVGIVLFILWRKEHPGAAKFALAGAIVPLAVFMLIELFSIAI